MNLPVGKTIERDLKLSKVDKKKILTDLFDGLFTGYIVLTVEGKTGIEEGLLLFEKGELKGSIFEEISKENELMGDIALIKSMNAFAAKEGIIDVNSLTKQQVELIIAFQENILITKTTKAEELIKLIPKTYDSIKKENKKETKIDIFKKIGLLGMEK